MIFYSFSISGQDIPKFDVQSIDKLFHFVEYMVLAYLLARALFHSSVKPNYKYIFIASVAITLLYGASDEFHQSFVPQRTCDIFDLITDLIGGFAGAGLSLYKERIKSAVDKAV